MSLAFEEFSLDWQKMDGLIPAIVQDVTSKKILMLGYMNQESLRQTLISKQVVFYSRSSAQLWTKGETSGNYLQWCEIVPDCDNDALLITAKPLGPTCHKGTVSCFQTQEATPLHAAACPRHPVMVMDMITQLEQTILARQTENSSVSYVASLFAAGISKMAQKVGEEGVEVALAAVADSPSALCEEVADLLFHVLVLLRAKAINFSDVLTVLERRAQKSA